MALSQYNSHFTTIYIHKQVKTMEEELNYLSTRIDELETEVSFYEGESSKTESERERDDLNGILKRKLTELEILENIEIFIVLNVMQ